ncbi:MAG TPA: DUF4426 domain-containing protein [Spongiibacteraceae bacterium]
MRLLIVFLALLSFNVGAQTDDNAPTIETSKIFGNYLVLYNAFPSVNLLPAIAADYQIERGSDIAFINIAVRNQANGGDVAQAVTINGTYSDLMQKKPLEFREIREQNAVYYIAQLRYNNREVLRFDMEVTPVLNAGEVAPIGAPFKISFTRKFFIEP